MATTEEVHTTALLAPSGKKSTRKKTMMERVHQVYIERAPGAVPPKPFFVIPEEALQKMGKERERFEAFKG